MIPMIMVLVLALLFGSHRCRVIPGNVTKILAIPPPLPRAKWLTEYG